MGENGIAAASTNAAGRRAHLRGGASGIAGSPRSGGVIKSESGQKRTWLVSIPRFPGPATSAEMSAHSAEYFDPRNSSSASSAVHSFTVSSCRFST